MAIGGCAAALAYEMGFGDFHHPGPGFFPFWLSSILAVVSFGYFLTRLGPDAEKVALWSKGSWIRPSLAGCVMFAYSLGMGWIGFFSSTFLLFIVWLVFIEREKWRTIGAVSVLGTLAMYVVFTVFLKVPLPKGLFF